MTVLVWLVACLVGISAGLVLMLVILRVTADLRAKRRAHAHAVTRELVLTVLMGEPDEVQRARDRLAQLTGEEGTQAESQIFAYLPKVTGETRTLLVDLVTARGAVFRARTLLNSWSAVRRCRGAYRLGALHRTDAVPQLVPMLRDRTFLVRRVALRALGAIGDPAAVVPILRTCGGDDRLTRDLVSALERIGQAGAPAMRAELSKGMARSSGSGRQAELATVGLGLVGDVGSEMCIRDSPGAGQRTHPSRRAGPLDRGRCPRGHRRPGGRARPGPGTRPGATDDQPHAGRLPAQARRAGDRHPAWPPLAVRRRGPRRPRPPRSELTWTGWARSRR